MINKTLSGQQSKDKLLEGIKIINEAVSSTLGPAGRNVLIENEDGTIRITKDGVTVANSLKKIEDPISNMAVQLLKQVANKSADKAGDGTTTSTLLASIIVQEGIKSIRQGMNPVEVKKGIDDAVKIVVDYLRSISKEISSNEQIQQVATISANSDKEIGKIITEALLKVGQDGIVTIEESKTGEMYLESVEGMSLDRGYKSPYFVTDNNTMQAILEKPRVLICGDNFTQAKELLPFLEKISTAGESLLIVAADVDHEALATLIINKSRGAIKVAAIKAPQFGERRDHILEDIAILTGGIVISKGKGDNLLKFPKDRIDEVLGKARLITVGKDSTTIVDGKGDTEAIGKRLEELKTQIDNSTSKYETEQLQQRLAKLVGGVSIIHVGANSEVELKEKKDRVDDALHATKAAIEEGILPGGGIALINAIENLKNFQSTDSDSYDTGFNIVMKALEGPFKRILQNAGKENHYEILTNIKSNQLADDNVWNGYNVKTEEYENFLESGVLDPTKVTRNAIENAASVAGIILTTESVIYLEKDKTEGGEAQDDLSQFM
jgi:chaperonin GroEL